MVLLLAVFGLSMLTDLTFRGLKRREHFDLFLMLWILIPLPLVYYGHLPMKFLLPCLPAVILLCFRLLDGVSVTVCPSCGPGVDRCRALAILF